MRADAQKISDVIERFNQERLSNNPPQVQKLLITHDKIKARAWCHECNYGFLTFQSWQAHHTEVHIKNAKNH